MGEKLRNMQISLLSLLALRKVFYLPRRRLPILGLFAAFRTDYSAHLAYDALQEVIKLRTRRVTASGVFSGV